MNRYTYRAWNTLQEIEGHFESTPSTALKDLRVCFPGADPKLCKVALYRMTFFIPGVPRSRQSVNVVTRKLKSGGTKTWGYHSDQAEPWKDAAMAAVRKAIEEQPCSPVMPIPSAHPATVELLYAAPIPQRRNRKCIPGYPVGVAPDLGNLEKPLLDALASAGLFANDSRVFRKTEEKRYVQDGAEVGCLVTVTWHTQYPEIIAEKDSRRTCPKKTKSKSSKPSSAPKVKRRSTSGSPSTAKRFWAGSRRRA